ncbi:MAG TPA: DNA-binding protein [Oxalobacteraceae bacterium]|nr:DNA-binding protein [Oxalobacteraceae bacterium]
MIAGFPGSTSRMNAFLIDAFEYSRHKEQRQGDIAVADLVRLTEELADKSGSLHWSLLGEVDSLGFSQLRLSVSGLVRLMCQRCLVPFAFEIASDSRLILAKDEANADEIDALLADDTVDVIVGSKVLNVAELIEDEALLAIPLAPKHKACPDRAAPERLQGAQKPSPFAVLKNIKQ